MTITVDRRLFLTADDELVEEGDPRAAFLWAGEGTEVSDEEAERVGYKAPKKAKEADPPENKAVEAPEADKAPAKRTRKATKKAT